MITKAQAKRDAIRKWEFIVDMAPSILDIKKHNREWETVLMHWLLQCHPDMITYIHNSMCAFCYKYGCENDCPLVACSGDKSLYHKWYKDPSLRNAKAMLKKIKGI